MKTIRTHLLSTLLLPSLVNPLAAGTVTVSSSAPANNILVENNTGTTYSRIFDEDNSSDHARGQLFSLANGAMTHYQITAVTIQKNGDQTFSSDTITLRIFEGTSAQWDSGTGHSTANDGHDYYVDTTVTPLYVETFTVNGTIRDDRYVTFELTTPLTVNENSDFGFFITYDESDSSSPDYFQYNEGSDGGRFSITNSAHNVANRHVRYLIQGIPSDAGDPDSDNDGLTDTWELLHFQDLDETASGNPDGDGLDNEDEEAAGTDPNKQDSDNDGLDDHIEVAGPTDPLDDDSDNDSLLDGAETGNGVYVSNENTGTDPMLADSDGDEIPDGTEINRGSDPSDPNHTPRELPNIIFIMIDDLDIREIGVYGQATLKTPRIDTMASQGMMFTDYP